jgi:hypothetical protein
LNSRRKRVGVGLDRLGQQFEQRSRLLVREVEDHCGSSPSTARTCSIGHFNTLAMIDAVSFGCRQPFELGVCGLRLPGASEAV